LKRREKKTSRLFKSSMQTPGFDSQGSSRNREYQLQPKKMRKLLRNLTIDPSDDLTDDLTPFFKKVQAKEADWELMERDEPGSVKNLLLKNEQKKIKHDLLVKEKARELFKLPMIDEHKASHVPLHKPT